MTQTIAQNLIINSKANNRNTNYNTHPLEVFTDLDIHINTNKTYNTILNRLNELESNYNNTIEELDNLISEARQTNVKLKEDKILLDLIPLYTYSIPNKTSFITLQRTINTLIEDCNRIINNILDNTVTNIDIYTNVLILDAISSSVNALINKQWLNTYISTLPKIPKVRPANATLICDSNGEIKWQQ